jgi:hypothetical protein
VPNTRSRLEMRLAQLLAATDLIAARHTAGPAEVDLVHLDEGSQERLTRSLRE